MATEKQRQQLLSRVGALLKNTEQIDLQPLLHKEFGPFHLEQAAPLMTKVLDAFKILRGLEIGGLPVSSLETIEKCIQTFNALASSMNSFEVSGNAEDKKRELLISIDATTDDIVEQLMLPISFATSQSQEGSFRASVLEVQIEKALTDLNSRVNHHEGRLQKLAQLAEEDFHVVIGGGVNPQVGKDRESEQRATVLLGDRSFHQ